MASKNIKGLTVEIGGDTTKLGKALDGVQKQSSDLSKELGEINKLLKMDPGNTDLLAQKQKVLADAVGATKEKLDTLKEAEKQVQEQFERGEVSEAQMRDLQREIIATSKKLESYEKAAADTAKELKDLEKASDKTADEVEDTGEEADDAAKDVDDFAEATEEAAESSEGFGAVLSGGVAKGLAALTAGCTAAIGALVGSAEATKEYRTAMGKLDTAFVSAGHDARNAEKTYKALQGVLGETDQAVEAAAHLAQLCDTEEELADWTTIATGVYGTFGASLPIEGLTEAANETAKVGALTGGLADALNWAGVNEEEFQAKLDACNGEQERAALITETLYELYGDAADIYSVYNKELIRANQANEEWTASMAEIGEVVEPIITDVKMLGASLLSDFVPGVKELATAFRGLLNGDAGAAEDFGAALSGIFEQLGSKLLDLLPVVSDIAVNLIGTLVTNLVRGLPRVVELLADVVTQAAGTISELVPTMGPAISEAIVGVVKAISSSLPQIFLAVSDIFFEVLWELPNMLGSLFNGFVDIVNDLATNVLPDLLEAIVVRIPELLVQLLYGIIPELIPLWVDVQKSLISMLSTTLPEIMDTLFWLVEELVLMLAEQLPILLPEIVKMLVSLIQMLAEQLPSLISVLTNLVLDLVLLIVDLLPTIVPLLIEACISIVMALVKALPDILVSLVQALPKILEVIWDVIVMAFVDLPQWFWQLLVGTFDMLVAGLESFGNFLIGCWEWLCELFAPAGEFFSELFSGAWEGIKSAWSGVTNFFSNIWKGIQNAFGSVADWFKNIFTKAWSAVTKVFSAGGKIFDGIKEGILSVFKTVVNGIIKGLNTVIALPLKGLNGILDTIQNISFLGISPFDWLSWRIPIPQIPLLAKGGVLEKGQVGLLEGNGAEAVVPLEHNTEWIRKVAKEFLAQMESATGLPTFDGSGSAAAGQAQGILGKLDALLAAIEHGQVLLLDGDALVGGTADRMNEKLGQLSVLAARGAN